MLLSNFFNSIRVLFIISYAQVSFCYLFGVNNKLSYIARKQKMSCKINIIIICLINFIYLIKFDTLWENNITAYPFDAKNSPITDNMDV